MAERVDWQAERVAFLSDARSTHTRDVYARALEHTERVADLIDAPLEEREKGAAGRDGEAHGVRVLPAHCAPVPDEIVCQAAPQPVSRESHAWLARKAGVDVDGRPSAAEMKVLQAEAEPALVAALAVGIETVLRVGGRPGLTIRDDGTWHTLSKAHRLQAAEPHSAGTLRSIGAAGLDPRRPIDPATFPRGPGLLDGLTKGGPEELLIARLKTRLARLCRQLTLEGKLAAVYSWHDLRHAYAERNAGRGLLWLRDRLGHSSVAVTERDLRNTLSANTKRM